MFIEMNTEIIAYLGMMLILLAFFMETRNVIESKAPLYLLLMAVGSGLLAIRAYLIQEWAFFILEIAWFLTAVAGLFYLNRDSE
tara:strand:+ start:241 stop:492 length:252 start_codon:yes stop_codon:yes gene_type:complete